MDFQAGIALASHSKADQRGGGGAGWTVGDRYFAKKSPRMPKEVNILPQPNLDNLLIFQKLSVFHPRN